MEQEELNRASWKGKIDEGVWGGITNTKDL